jgi:hypothetical protein
MTEQQEPNKDFFQLSRFLGRPGVSEADGLPRNYLGKLPYYSREVRETELPLIVRDFQIFTTGISRLTIPFDLDSLLPAFFADYRRDEVILFLHLDVTILPDLYHPDPNLPQDTRSYWTRTLQAIHKEHWEAFRSWHCQCAFHKRDSRRLYRIREQTFTVSVATGDVDVSFFWTETNQGSVVPARPAISVGWPRVIARPDLKWEDTAVFEEQVSQEETDPYATKTAEPILPAEGIVQKEGEEPHVVEGPPDLAERYGRQSSSTESKRSDD